MGVLNSTSAKDGEPHVASGSSAFVEPHRVAKVHEHLRDSEIVYYLLQGNSVHIEHTSAGLLSSLLGRDETTKRGTGGYVRTVVTDGRILIHVPKLLSEQAYEIPYRRIRSVDMTRRLVRTEVTVETLEETYTIIVGSPSKDEVGDAARFIQDKTRHR